MSDYTALLPALTADEYEALKVDIAERGCLVPVELDEDGNVLDGAHRQRACDELGIAPPTITRRGLSDAEKRAHAIALNLQRRQLTREQTRGLLAELVKAEPERSDRQHATAAGVSPTTVGAVRADLVARGQLSKLDSRIGADGTTRSVPRPAPVLDFPEATTREKVERDELRAAKMAEHRDPIPPPAGTYSTVVIDPPWPMQKIEREVRPNQVKPLDYPPMSEADLRELPIPAAADAHLYLWTTHKFLPVALRLCEAWGFNYQCLLTWRKNVGFTPFSFMYSTEHVVFARRGSLDLLVKGRRLDFEAKVREHSRKPDVFYELVRDVSPAPRIDMFSREDREGFDAWGNEEGKFADAA